MAISAERFVREKLASEISSFGDGKLEFHTREIQLLLERLDEKDVELINLNKENVRLCNMVNKLNSDILK